MLATARIGATMFGGKSEYLARLFQQRSQSRIIRFDEQPISSAELDDLSSELWERFRTPRTGDDRDDMLSKLRMARIDEDGILRPTVAGVLMASKNPQQWMPNAHVQAVAYRGNEVATGRPRHLYQLDAADIFGTLDSQVVETCRFVNSNMKTAAFKDQGRIDLPQYDMTAVFEAVVNAVAHRDYSIYGSKIRLRMFANRLELYSPGSLPNTIGIESLPYVQSSRNGIITSLLARASIPSDAPWLTTDRRTMMDRRGEGVSIILENSRRLSGIEPEYRAIGDSELMLTIYAAGFGQEYSCG